MGSVLYGVSPSSSLSLFASSMSSFSNAVSMTLIPRRIASEILGISSASRCSFVFSYNIVETREIYDFYHPRMRVGNVFSHVCLSVCLSVFLSVQAITFEPLDIETSFLVCRYIFTISRSSLSIKVIGSRSRSYEKK